MARWSIDQHPPTKRHRSCAAAAAWQQRRDTRDRAFDNGAGASGSAIADVSCPERAGAQIALTGHGRRMASARRVGKGDVAIVIGCGRSASVICAEVARGTVITSDRPAVVPSQPPVAPRPHESIPLQDSPYAVAADWTGGTC